MSERIRRLTDDLLTGTVVGLVTGVAVFALGVYVDNQRTAVQERVENLRFVRDRSSEDENQPRPFRSLDLAEQSLAGLRLSGAELVGANLRESDMRFIQLSRAILVNADLEKAALSQSTLYEARFEGAKLQEAKVNNAFAKGANFKASDLRAVDFSGTSLQGADFTDAVNLAEANLNGSCWDTTTKWPANFTPPQSGDPNSCPQ